MPSRRIDYLSRSVGGRAAHTVKSQTSGVASTPRLLRESVDTGGLTPNGTYFGDELGDCRLSLRERTPFRGAKGDKVSAIGRSPSLARRVSFQLSDCLLEFDAYHASRPVPL